MTFGRGASGEERVAMRRGEDWVAVQLGGGVTAPMRARLAAVDALGRLVATSAHLRAAVADVVSDLVTVAVRRGGAANRDHTIEVRLERRDGALRVTVRDDAVAPFALDGAPLHATAAHGCLTGAEPHGAWAELRL
jgi:hypothetical protein